MAKRVTCPGKLNFRTDVCRWGRGADHGQFFECPPLETEGFK